MPTMALTIRAFPTWPCPSATWTTTVSGCGGSAGGGHGLGRAVDDLDQRGVVDREAAGDHHGVRRAHTLAGVQVDPPYMYLADRTRQFGVGVVATRPGPVQPRA